MNGRKKISFCFGIVGLVGASALALHKQQQMLVLSLAEKQSLHDGINDADLPFDPRPHNSPRPAEAIAPDDYHKRVYDKGRILVIETDDAPSSQYVVLEAPDYVTIITASKEKTEQFSTLLWAGDITPGFTLERAPRSSIVQIQTLDEYIAFLENNSRKGNVDDNKYVASKRAELEQQLRNHDAVIKRTVHIKRSGE